MQPLADRIRPQTLAEFAGQDKLVGQHGPIAKMLAAKTIHNMIFWGPPASGKTTLARIIGTNVEAEFVALSAVMSGKEDLKKVISTAKMNVQYNKNTVLFVDEIHRWNKAQQDALLPYVEDGTIILIGATTENPSFSIISPLLSRLQVYILEALNETELRRVLERGFEIVTTKKPTTAEQELLMQLVHMSDGDARYALTVLETTLAINPQLSKSALEDVSQRNLHYDKGGEEHYNLISAVHKSLRSSNASAGVYWMMRMLEAGDDPLYIARRLIRFASEDIGNANPNALLLANQVHYTVRSIGMPECSVALVQLAQYLANSAKDNSAYAAQASAQQQIRQFGSLPVPMHLRNAPTKLMKDAGYAKGYEYDHNLESKKSNQECFPDALKGTDYFV